VTSRFCALPNAVAFACRCVEHSRSYFGPHVATDARAMMPLMELVYDWMFEALDGKSGPEIKWGEETARLAPTMAACTGELFPTPQSEEAKSSDGSAVAPPGPPPFVRAGSLLGQTCAQAPDRYLFFRQW
jgi:hypothetical protein